MMLGLLAAHAGKSNDRIAANASEIPALASLLEKTGWQPMPELTGGFRPGDIFRFSEEGHVLEGSGCFDADVRESTYTQVELVTELQSGVSVRFLGVGKASAEGELIKKLKFGTPQHLAIAGFDLDLSPGCRAAILRQEPADQAQLLVIREVLVAEIAEQTCGRVSAEGRFVGLGSAEADLQTACQQLTLGPVAVGFRTQPVQTLLELAPLPNPGGNIGVTPLTPSRAVAGSPSQSHWSGLQAPVSHLGRELYRDGSGRTRQMVELSPLLKRNNGDWLFDQHDRAKARRNRAAWTTALGGITWIAGTVLITSSCLEDQPAQCTTGAALSATGGFALIGGPIWWAIDGKRVARSRRDIADAATSALIAGE